MPLWNLLGKDFLFTETGFLTNPGDWSNQLASAIANKCKLTLTPRHWDVIQYLRTRFEASGEIPLLRHLCKDLQLSLPSLYFLFPEGRRQACRIAGLHKPEGCRDN
jgi:tRNA 2-thiouridine synthesizing protein E